ncbi:MAG: hypothetical protein MUO94_05890 [Thermoplasmata archaeon]|nr:hypothetical protein [Thermoplasmata archaeon]
MMACVEAYGCSLNVGEAAEIEEMLLERGWELASVCLLVAAGCMATALRVDAEEIVPGASVIPPGDMARISDIAVSTDIIVGYPGETVSDHEANLEVVREVRPDIVNVTRFSPRKGTPAASETPRIVGWVAKERSGEMADVRFEVSLERNQEWVGRTVSALATERGEPGTTIMRTDEYRQVVVPEGLPLGLLFPVLVEGATPTYLSGSRCDVS